MRRSNKKIILNIGTSCNNNCRFCYNSGGRAIERKPTLGEVKAAIASAKLKGKFIELFGGECTMQPEFFEVIRAIEKEGVYFSISSNLRLFSYKQFVDKLPKKYLYAVQTSLHSDKAAVHDWLTRSKGSFEQTIKGIKNVKDMGIEVTVITVLLKQNLGDLKGLIKLADSLGVDKMKFSFLEILGNAKEEYKKIAPKLKETGPYLVDALKYANQKNMKVIIEKGPTCAAPDFKKNYFIEKYLVDGGFFVKGDYCKKCRYSGSCMGVCKGYASLYGLEELPVTKF